MKYEDQLREKAQLLTVEAAKLRNMLESKGVDPDSRPDLFSSSFRAIEKIYSKDIPKARAMEVSDYIIRYQPASGVKQTLSLVNKLYGNVLYPLKSTARSYTRIGEDSPKWNDDVEPVLTLLNEDFEIGFSMPQSDPDQSEMFEHPQIEALEKGVYALETISRGLCESASRSELIEAVEDPYAFDCGVVGIRRMIAYADKRVQGLNFAGKGLKQAGEIQLSKKDWVRAGALLAEAPKGQPLDIKGSLKEINFETRRLELHYLDMEKGKIRILRGVFQDGHKEDCRTYANRSVVLSGKVDYNRMGEPRLMHIDSFKQP